MLSELLDEILRRVIKANEHDVKVAMQDAEVEAKAELLLGCQLWDSLRMLKFKGQAFLLLQRVFLLLLPIQSLVLLPVDVHTFEHV